MFVAGCGSVWLERLVWDQEVAGSNPVTPILLKVLKMAETLENIKNFSHFSVNF